MLNNFSASSRLVGGVFFKSDDVSSGGKVVSSSDSITSQSTFVDCLCLSESFGTTFQIGFGVLASSGLGALPQVTGSGCALCVSIDFQITWA